MAQKPYFAKTKNTLIATNGIRMSVSPDVRMCTRFLEDYRTFIAAILVNSVGIGAINLTALVTPVSKTGFHQTIEESPRQIQIQLNQCSTTLLAKNGNH